MQKALLALLSLVLLSSCGEKCYYDTIYATLSHYRTRGKKYDYTPSGVKVYLNGQPTSLQEIDDKVVDLEQCLNITIKRSCFAVYIAEDWFTSTCSGEQLLPVPAPIEQCAAKGLDVDEKCEGLRTPTDECPCICNYRVSLQYNYLIVVPPNTKLLKAELARLVTGVNNPWTNEQIRRCL